MIERQTAKKVSIASLVGGQWVKKEGMEPSYIVTAAGEQISRARILGTVVGKFTAEDGMFASVTLDDATETVRAKVFKGVKPLDTVAIGDVVDVIGKVREWNGEVYVIPEIVAKVEDPNAELLRRLELSLKERSPGQPAAQPKEDLRALVIGIIESEKGGISYDALIKKSGKPEPAVEKVITDLLDEGVCYEPTPGKIKKI